MPEAHDRAMPVATTAPPSRVGEEPAPLDQVKAGVPVDAQPRLHLGP